MDEGSKTAEVGRASRLVKAKLTIRTATAADVGAITELSRRVYGAEAASTEEMIRGQINTWPEGQFVAELEGAIVGYCATFIIGEDLALRPHSWSEITGHGFASRHDPDGDYLYGMEVTVDPSHRRLRIGQRLYNARKELCQYHELKGIVFGGRMPGYARRRKEVSGPREYVEKVLAKQYRDSVINFQVNQGFEVIGVLENYLPSDRESDGNAVHMIWRNPLEVDENFVRSTRADRRLPETVRVATVQFQMRKISSVEEFEEQIEYFVDVASDYSSDFVVFPELFTLQLLSIESKPATPAAAVRKIAESYTGRFKELMARLAVAYNINIIGGSHLTLADGDAIRNVSYVFLRDGAVYAQEKIHATPAERRWWHVEGGDRVAAIETDCGPIGVLICYDSEFPELARHLTDQGAMILFVPFCTDERRGYLRVRYCCHARAIENQCYVVLSGVVGNLPNVDNMDIHYAESCVLTPSDFAFSRDAVAADSAPNTETVIFADLSLHALLTSRQSGAVQNLRDRRFDLYSINWKGRSGA